MRAPEAVRLILVLVLGLLSGSELRKHYVAAPEAAAAPSSTPTAIPDSTKPASPQGDGGAAGDAATPNADDDAENSGDADPGFDPEVVMYDQHKLMAQSLARLAPQVPGKTDLYFLAFGADGGQDVFRNEAEYAERLMTTRFDATGHTLALINNPATVDARPLATWSNLDLALTGLEKTMDPSEDVLVLFLTSHGSSDHVLLVDLDPLPLDQIGAEDLAEILAKHPFRWKVVIVSACYSGGFVTPLKNATTMVITASSAERASFGCETDSEITWFGKAFFVEGLNQSDSFKGAFGIAKNLVDEWETRDGETHSEPQIASTPLIETKLRAWRDGIHLGPVVPFVPAVPAADTLTAKQ